MLAQGGSRLSSICTARVRSPFLAWPHPDVRNVLPPLTAYDVMWVGTLPLDAAMDAAEELEATANLVLLLDGKPTNPLSPTATAELNEAFSS